VREVVDILRMTLENDTFGFSIFLLSVNNEPISGQSLCQAIRELSYTIL